MARYERDGSRTTIVDRYEGKRLNSPNDLVVASDGAIWFTDPPYGILDDSEGYRADSELGCCFVFRLGRATGELTIATDAPVHPNGLAFSPDETILYVSDTSITRIAGGNHHIVAFDVIDRRTLASPASSSGESSCRRPATARSAAPMAAACSSPPRRRSGRSRSGSAAPSRHGWTLSADRPWPGNAAAEDAVLDDRPWSMVIACGS